MLWFLIHSTLIIVHGKVTTVIKFPWLAMVLKGFLSGSAVLSLLLLCSCDALNQDPTDVQHDIFIYNETVNTCPMLVYMDSQFQFRLPFNCPNCAILAVEPGIHVLEAFREQDDAPGALAAAVVINLDNYEDWWWRIRYCPPEAED